MNPPKAPAPTSTQPVKGKHAATISGRDEALRLLGVCAVGAIIWLIPPPGGVEPRAWHLLAIFVATIVGIIAKPLPMGAIALLGIAMTALSGTLTINQALSGFGNSTIWLIVVAFFISRGFIKTGLGSRIAYLFMAALGKKTLGLGYGLIATDLVLAPAIPSNTARAGGMVFPLVRASAQAFGSEPDELFASQTAHVSSMYEAFLSVAVAVGTPPLLAALVLGFAGNLFSSLTHYGSGPAPVLFGSGYVELSTWWKLGFLASLINILIWLIAGGLWWKLLGLW